MARALIVGCGCRGRTLGSRLVEAGWLVRGTTRDPDNSEQIAGAGLDAAVADPDRVGTLLDHIADVTLVFWLLGSAAGDADAVAALHGPRLARMLEELVDTPVRGFVYESSGEVSRDARRHGAGIVASAARRWRIPVEIVDTDPDEWKAWTEAMLAASQRLTAPARPG